MVPQGCVKEKLRDMGGSIGKKRANLKPKITESSGLSSHLSTSVIPQVKFLSTNLCFVPMVARIDGEMNRLKQVLQC